MSRATLGAIAALLLLACAMPVAMGQLPTSVPTLPTVTLPTNTSAPTTTTPIPTTSPTVSITTPTLTTSASPTSTSSVATTSGTTQTSAVVTTTGGTNSLLRDLTRPTVITFSFQTSTQAPGEKDLIDLPSPTGEEGNATNSTTPAPPRASGSSTVLPGFQLALGLGGLAVVVAILGRK